jgi:hypothetical protein
MATRAREAVRKAIDGIARPREAAREAIDPVSRSREAGRSSIGLASRAGRAAGWNVAPAAAFAEKQAAPSFISCVLVHLEHPGLWLEG